MKNLLPFLNSSGITIPISALRSKRDFGIGDIEDAYLFIDFLAKSSFKVWKLLPVNPTLISGFDSPYDAESAFALDMLYIDISHLEDIDYTKADKFLSLLTEKSDKNNKVEFERTRKIKSQFLKLAFHTFYNTVYQRNQERTEQFELFQQDNKYWLDEYALFKTLQKDFGEIFLGLWPDEYFYRDAAALQRYKQLHVEDILYFKYVQWIITTQWLKMKKYANDKGIFLMGDIPSFIEAGSADVWAQREFFNVNDHLMPTIYGGAPPDQFNTEGQVWEMVSSNWETQKEDNYVWSKNRLTHMSYFFDGLRLDYFMIYVEYWTIKIGNKATEGEWVKGPGMDFLNNVIKEVSDKHLCKFIAEVPSIDPTLLQHIHTVLKEIGCDLCVILAYDFEHILRENIGTQFTLETSTHDTPPLKVLWKTMKVEDKQHILKKLGTSSKDLLEYSDTLRWEIIDKVMLLPVHTVIFPIQDILGISDQINAPGTVGGDNWAFRLDRYIEDMIEDSYLINQLQTASKLSKRNDYYEDYFIRSLPLINGEVKRNYKLSEIITVWGFAEKEVQPTIVTNLPLNITEIDAVHEYSMQLIEQTEAGNLYRFEIEAVKNGSFFITIKQGETYISSFQRDLTIIVTA